MKIRVFTLLHHVDDKGKSVTLHPSLRHVYLLLCKWYSLDPLIGSYDIVDIKSLDDACIRTGITSVMQDHDDGYEIFMHVVDCHQYAKLQE